VIRKDAEQRQQVTSRQTDAKPFMVMEAEDVSTLMQSSADESHIAPSLLSNHSAYINVSQSDDDSQHTTSDRGAFVTHWLFTFTSYVSFSSDNAPYCQFSLFSTAYS